MSTWCCDSFRTLLNIDGEKGYSIFASNDHGKNHFCLQARPFEKEVVEEFSQLDPKTGFARWPAIRTLNQMVVPLPSAIYLPLRYCPSCGFDLEKLIQENQNEFQLLVEQHLQSERK